MHRHEMVEYIIMKKEEMFKKDGRSLIFFSWKKERNAGAGVKSRKRRERSRGSRHA